MTSTTTGDRPLLTLTVDRPANGGEAVGRAADGRVVFVRGAIPGERVAVRVVDDRHERFWRAEVAEVLDASPHRIAPLCAAAAHGAGCCDLSFIDPAHARTLKGEVLVDVLGRIGHVPAEVLERSGLFTGGVRSLGGPDTGWRVRTRLAVDAEGHPGLHERQGPGIITGHRCAQPAPALLAAVDAGGYRPHAELAAMLDGGGDPHVVEIAPPAREPAPRARGRDTRRAAQRRRRGRAALRAQHVLVGGADAEQRVGERIWRIPVAGFWQAHVRAPSVYADTVAELVASSGVRTGVCWDLYGGAGVFTGTLLDACGAQTVHLVDSDPGAIAAAHATFADDGVLIHAGDVARQIAELPTPDVVVLDPPRTGAGRHVVDAITAAEPGLIVHIGCDAGTFARDLASYADAGYRIGDLRAFDAFGLTHHVEAIAALVPAAAG